MNENDALGVLIEAAKTNRICEIHYRKAVTRSSPQPRFVEPYSLSTGKQDTLVRCYQIDPDAGWRTFMLHKIESACLTDIEYKPRRKATIVTAEVHLQYEPSNHWTEKRIEYRDFICDILADGFVSSDELSQTHSFIKSASLDVDDIRFVHANLYHRALGAIIQDGFLTETEVAEARFLHKVFHALGWAIGE